MATFETQVEALTGLSIDGSSNPTQTELSLFLVDGVKDVIHRMIEAKPEELVRFTSTTNSTSSIAKVGKILSVMREHDSTTILRKCTAIDPGDRYDATDSESLNYRSKTSPGFYELNGSIFTVPAAGSGDNDIVVTQIYYDTGVAYGDEVPDNFPESYAYLVALYAAIKTVHRKMGAEIISITAVPPDVPTAPSFATVTVSLQTAGSLGTAPTYTKPTVGGTADELTDITALDSENTVDDFDGNAIEIDQWFATVAHYIEGEEDSELAGTQLQKIATYISAFSQEMASAMNTFNQANVLYQSTVQEAMKELDVASAKAQKDADFEQQKEIQEYSAKLQRYSAEVTEYSAEVNTEVQEKTTKMQHYQILYAQLLREYESAFVAPGAEE